MAQSKFKPAISWLLVIAMAVMLLPVGQLPARADDPPVNVALNKTVTVSSEGNYDDGWGPKEGALDGDYDTAWVPAADDWVSPWLMVDLGQPYTISKYILTANSLSGEPETGAGRFSGCRDFKLQTSDDGENFTDIDTVTNNYADFFYEKTLTDPQTARYFKLLITGSDGEPQIIELGLFTGGTAEGGAVMPDGTGTETDPYLITEPGNLIWMSEQIGDSDNFSGQYFQQENDIDLSVVEDFVPIGNMFSDISSSFGGIYDGNNYKITHLAVNDSPGYGLGLFGAIQGGEIKNLELKDVTINCANPAVMAVGALAGYNYFGTMSNCQVTGNSSITGLSPAGGLVGEIQSATMDCCSNAASVTSSGYAGGITGACYYLSSISNCYNLGSVAGGDGTYAGGIAGDTDMGISIENCYNAGTMIKGGTTYAAGVVGSIGSDFNAAQVTLSNSFYLNTSVPDGSGLYGNDCSGHDHSAIFTAGQKSAAEMKTGATFQAAGWDFTNTWAIVDTDTHYSYPYLRSMPWIAADETEAPGYCLKGSSDPGSGDLWDGTIAPAFGGGAGTADEPYEINTSAQLARLAQLVTSNTTDPANGDAGYASLHYVLTADLDLNGRQWNTIGDRINSFKGVFNGNGHKVSNLVVGTPASPDAAFQYVGLFGYLENATVCNLGVENAAVYSSYGVPFSSFGYIGVLTGSATNAVFYNVYTTGTVSASGFGASTGGIAGAADSSAITNAYSTCSVTGSSSGTTATGGLFGRFANNNCAITNCYSAGTVSGGSFQIGGIAGYTTSCTITYGYYRQDESMLPGVGYGTDTATAMTAADMQSAAFATTLNDNVTVLNNNALRGWELISGLNGGYPMLSGAENPETGAFVAKVNLPDKDGTINAGADDPLLIPYEISFNLPFDSTCKLTELKTTISFNNTSLKPHDTPAGNIAGGGEYLLPGNENIIVDNSVVNGTTTSFDVTYSDPAGIDAANGTLFGISMYIRKDAVAGKTVIYATDTTMNLTKSGQEYRLGTALNPIEEIPCAVTLTKAVDCGLSLSPAEADYIYGGDTVSDKSRITTTGNVINADNGTEITVPVVNLSGHLDNLGAIKANFRFNPALMTFTGIVGEEFVGEAVLDHSGKQTGEIKVYVDPAKVPAVVDYPTPYQFKFKFTLTGRPSSNTDTIVETASFKVFPVINGTVSDDVYKELSNGEQNQTISFLDYGEISKSEIMNGPTGNAITSIVKEGDDDLTLYSRYAATEPLDPVTYGYQWFTNQGGDNFTTPIVGATGDSFAVTDAYIGYRVKVIVTMKNGESELHSRLSDSVLIEPKAPVIAIGSLSKPDGFVTGKSIGYDPSITYTGSLRTTTCQWSYSETENGVYTDIDGATGKNLIIEASYINKWLKFTVNAEEEIGECVKTASEAAKFRLGGEGNVPKPVVTSVTIVDNDGGAISDAARARDNGTIKAQVSVTDTAGILTGYSYEWYRNGATIAGATNESYSLRKEDVGGDITVKAYALSDYYTKEESSALTSAAIKVYANRNNAPVITVDPAAVSVTENKYVLGNKITVPFTLSKYYNAAGNESSITSLAYSVKSGDDQTAADTLIADASALGLAEESFAYTITPGDMNKRYIVFKLMAKEHTIDEDIAVGSTVIAVDTHTGQSVNWTYTLDYEVSDNAVFNNYRAYAIITNIGANNILNITVNNEVVPDTQAGIFYAPERGRYVALMPKAVTPDLNKFTFSTGSTEVIYYGKQANTSGNLGADDMMKPINVWLKKGTNATSKNLLISEVSGNGEQDPIDAVQIALAILGGSPGGPDQKAGNFGILSK